MNYLEFEALRKLNATMGIFLTEHCPVQCNHCAVAAFSKPSPPSKKLIPLIQEMANLPNLRAVAITGGEPFAYPAQLLEVVNTLREGGKKVVIYTSCYWGKSVSSLKIRSILSAIDGIIVGLDRYHGQHISRNVLSEALVAATEEKCWITAQVIQIHGENQHWEYATSILEQAFSDSPDRQKHVELIPTTPLNTGRAEALFNSKGKKLKKDTICHAIKGPTLLSDGSLAACCNPDVVRYRGPDCLRTSTETSLRSALNVLGETPLVEMLKTWPPRLLNELVSLINDPNCTSFKKHTSQCAACWQAAQTLEKMDTTAVQLCRAISHKNLN